MTRDLATHECKGTCDWLPTDEISDGVRIFACKGCASEWAVTQSWTPRNADGQIAPIVQAERDAEQAARQAASTLATEVRPEGPGGGGGGGGW